MTKLEKDNNNLDQLKNKEKSQIKHNFLKILISIIILLFLTMSLIRIPYVGSFFDTVFFNTIFGYTKYFAYLLIYLIVIFWFFPNKFKKIFSKTNVLTILIFWVMINIIITAIALTILKINGTLPGMSDFKLYWFTENSNDGYFTNWLKNDWNNIGNYNYFFNIRSYGGILIYLIVVLFQVYATPLLAVIIGIVLILFIIFFIKNKTNYLNKIKENVLFKKNKVIKEEKIVNESNHSSKKESQVLIDKKNNIDKKESNKNVNYINTFLMKINKQNLIKNNITFLNETSIDSLHELKNNSKELKEKVGTIFSSLGIDYSFIDEKIMFKSIILKFKLKGKKSIDFINNNPEKFNNSFSNLTINWYINDNDEFVISTKYDLNPTINLYEIIQNIGENNHFVFGLGKSDNRKILSFNGLLSPNTLVFGSKGSGNSMLLCNMILSFASLNPSNIVDISIIDPTDKTFKYLSLLPQLSKYSYNELENSNLLAQFVNNIEIRLNLLKENNCTDIYEYKNKYVDDDNTKINLLVINCLEEVIKDKNNLNNLIFILENAKKVGIITLISMNLITDNILKIKYLFDNFIVLKVDSINDSNALLDSSNAFYLWGNGEGIFKNTNSQIQQFQSSFITKDKIELLIKEISK